MTCRVCGVVTEGEEGDLCGEFGCVGWGKKAPAIPDPITDSYGYMVWILRQILTDDSLNLESIRQLAYQGLDSAGECGE